MHIYEINTWTWLRGLSRANQSPITLANVPDDELAILKNLGVDTIWLMGVWQRGSAAIQIAAKHPDLQNEFRRSLPDFVTSDVSGSPYAVHRYEVDPKLGGRAGLAAFRKRVNKAGLKLILDFVPNHVAVDHPWTVEHPDALVQGNQDELELDSYSFFAVGDAIFAHGRDPYFPAWSDTTQVNAFSDQYRKLSIETLLDIAAQCDGVRCDMAMLMTNEVFSKTWSANRVGLAPQTEYWEVVIPSIQKEYPEFFFMAEVYWDMEYKLQQQGFAYCYDKRLYDRMKHENAISVNAHLHADIDYQNKLVRFIENHDEERAMASLGLQKSRMAALMVATLPGAKLWHEGQFDGNRIKLPVQLGRRPVENRDSQLYAFYNKLIHETHNDVYLQGEWTQLAVDRAWPENGSCDHLIAYAWHYKNERRLIVVNYSDVQSQGRVILTALKLAAGTWTLTDILDHDKAYHRDGKRMSTDGLYIDLALWTAHIFTLSMA